MSDLGEDEPEDYGTVMIRMGVLRANLLIVPKYKNMKVMSGRK